MNELQKKQIQQNSQEQFDNNTKALDVFYQTEQKNQQIKQLEEKNKIYTKNKKLHKYWYGKSNPLLPNISNMRKGLHLQ